MKNTLFITILFLSILNADDFERLNSSPTLTMIENIRKAKVCDNIAPVKENFNSDFRYGCFCGKNYPKIVSDTKKSYRVLNRNEKDKLIEKYYLIKPIDTIDEMCMKHDLCYISTGREDQLCNDTLYDELRKVSSQFYEIAKIKGRDSTEMRCERLSSDIGSVFKTIFASGDNVGMRRFGMFMMINTPMTVASKTIQKTSHRLNDSAQYPLANERCNLP